MRLLREVLALAGLAACLILPIVSWSRLPESIPTHFDLSGAPDAMGGKPSLLVLPGVAVVLYFALASTSMRLGGPGRWRLNRGRADEATMKEGSELTSTLRAWCLCLLGLLTWEAIQVGLGRRGHMNMPAIWTALALLPLLIAGHVVRLIRIQRRG